MKLSKLLTASLTVVSAIVVGASGADARNPAKGGLGCAPTLGTTEVFPAECGSDPATYATFQPTPGFPLVATVNEQTTLTGGYAGALIFTPNANNITNFTDLSLYTPIPQGTYSQTITAFAGSIGTGTVGLEQALAYSWQTKNGKTHYGITFVPFSFINGSQQFNNQALKNKSAILNLTTDTALLDLFNAGLLDNLIGKAPGKNNTDTSTFQLLGIASALTNLGDAGTSVTASFNNFSINNPVFTPGSGNLAKALCPDGSSLNINCAPFIPGGSAAAAAAARTH